MRLRRLEVRRFRKLAGPVVLDRLGDGITVIGGDNEEGKSTVLAALKAALFEPHGVGGAVREQMAPHDGGVPEVLVELEAGGGRYRLHKAFRKGGVSLDTPRGRLTGDAAEQALVDLLRFERRTAHKAKPQNLGLQAIFWLDQGTSFAGFEALEAGRDRFSAAVEAETGALAAGDRGRRLLQSVTAAARELWTPTWRETGPLAEASRRLQVLTAECEALRQRRQGYDAAIDRLARLRDDRRRAIEADELGRARETLLAARKAVAGVEALESELVLLRGEALLCRSQWQALEAQAERRRDLARRAAETAAAAAKAAEELVRLTGERERADVVAATAVDAETAAVDALAGIEREHEQASGQRRLVEITGRLARLRADHVAATEAAAAVERLRASLAANPATAESVAAAEEAQSRRREAAAALQVVATRLDFAPRMGATVLAAGNPHDPTGPLHIAERTELELGGFGRVTVLPGGGDVEKRRAALRRAEDGLAAALAAVGAVDTAQARAMLEGRRDDERRLAHAEARLDAVLASHAVADLPALSGRLTGAEVELAMLSARVTPPVEAADLDALIEGLEQRRRAGRLARDAAREEQQRTAKLATDRRMAAAGCEARRLELAEQQEAAQRALAEECQRCPEERLQDDLAAAAAAKAEAELRLAATERRFGAADAGFVRDRLAQAERRVAAIEAEAQRLDREIRDAEVELRSGEAQALGERLAEAEGELSRATADHTRLAQTARAWKLLHDELTAAVATARDALLAPVRQRIGPYLRRLFPEAEVALDPQTLALDRLRRGGVDERFNELSLGTREQLAIVVRLALAGLLQEKEGESPCLVLDDALVYADEVRLEVMKTILQQAANELQILILTCRPRDYRGLDARFLRLEDCIA
jgi:hypothetical protein